MKKYILTLIFLFVAMATATANSAETVIRGNAKFNTVVIVLGIIFIGIVMYLFRLDRKISRIEKWKESNK